ncbi:asparagine synthase (glutamine-hydrolyzing) [Aerosakkonemataceae cyanobacterium BLCC-F154]|uniref:asparagine synthase (glutamine-hydrolyzing) n=1 Tax=Floridaenema fluviatile BLCC-F154 TaxID=3153640 RepID=A0ABV4Y537_9CYAN
MCGLTGFFDTAQQMPIHNMVSVVQNMSDTLAHRGPDDRGIWTDAEKGIALGHRRLAILDLSPEGHQPMLSADGRYVIAFNGEIYNFLELRNQLQPLGHHFRGYSDTEIMLASFSEWGVERSLKRFNGMFAFALWDRWERVLYLGRDRLGEKPLYYGFLGRTLVFGSELKALKAYPNFPTEINRDALLLLLQFSYIPAPYSIYQNIYKLPPGTFLTCSGRNFPSQPVPYWSARTAAELGVANPLIGSEAEIEEQFEALLKDAVKLRMLADVPLGAFLSGGIDSSTVVALMQAQSSQPVKTFTIGFHEQAYNEAYYAQQVAQHLGTNHTELYVTPKETLAVIPKLPSLYDEPFADPSQIPTYLLSQLTREYVTVSLSGDGGDELFAGYDAYFWCRRLWQTVGWIPPALRQIAASGLVSVSPQTWNWLFERINPLLPTKVRFSHSGYRLHRLAEALASPDTETMYVNLASRWKDAKTTVIGTSDPVTTLSDRQSWAQLPDFTQRMMYLDLVSYLPDDILVKLDRASMGVSLEGRIPLLDHRVIEFAWRVPLSMKIRGTQSKWLLRQILYKYVPKNLVERPKSGFGIPIDRWLREPLRDWAEALLDEQRLRQEGFFHPQAIRQKWTEHLSGSRDWQYSLWNVLMFQAWLSEQKYLDIYPKYPGSLV